ncbi:membrane protein [Vibrio sinaloensis]|uniref:GlpM family protein n=1 Tax=Photobacterium sp. (strain ATCC 43367) TaxID=379097 RepID=UPI0005809553|nr:GlpM family protein [Vibrio sinaloensis]KIE21860.1 membrane protein [Vibrio sinaloensis]
MVSLFFKSLLGAGAVVLIALLSKSKNFYIAGLVPLFPTFALIAHFIVGSERNMEELRLTALFGLYSLLPYASYLIAVYYLSFRWSLIPTLGAATLVWLVAAATLMLVWTKTVMAPA